MLESWNLGSSRGWQVEPGLSFPLDPLPQPTADECPSGDGNPRAGHTPHWVGQVSGCLPNAPWLPAQSRRDDTEPVPRLLPGSEGSFQGARRSWVRPSLIGVGGLRGKGSRSPEPHPGVVVGELAVGYPRVKAPSPWCVLCCTIWLCLKNIASQKKLSRISRHQYWSF